MTVKIVSTLKKGLFPLCNLLVHGDINSSRKTKTGVEKLLLLGDKGLFDGSMGIKYFPSILISMKIGYSSF